MQPNVLTTKDLKPDQLEGIDMMMSFVADPGATEMLIEGPAGSGKTSMIRAGVGELDKDTQEGAVVCAPTNKAVKVARELSGGALETTTIYKLLSLSPQANGEIKEIKQGDMAHQKLMTVRLVVLDEGSMSHSSLRPYIERAIDDYGIKFIYVADRYQLPPVGEERSWVFDTRKAYRLTEVKRHDNAILNLATQMRQAMDNDCSKLNIVDDYNEAEGGVERFGRGRPFEERIIDTWTKLSEVVDGQEEGAEPDFSGHRILSWRNDRVAGYNETVRGMLYGRRTAKDNALMLGERVVVCNPVMSLQDDNVVLMNTDEEGFIDRIEVSTHPKYPEVECYRIVVRKESDGTLVGLFTPTPDGWRVANRALNNWRTKAQREDKIYWGAFWTMKEMMNDVRPCHALTTHRAQGSTFRETFIDLDDIMANPRRMEAYQSAYVALTRASYKANIKWGGF